MRAPEFVRRGLVALAAAAATATVLSAAAAWSRADADALQTKLVQIATNGLAEKPASRQTSVLEREVNAYIALHARAELPPGVLDPVVTILPDNRLTGRAIVDLDAVRASKQRGMLSPWALLGGKVPVEAQGILRTEKGVGAFTLESATVGGVPVPKTILQELVTYYSKGPAQPDGIDLEAPFRLPARIREIRTARGEALIVQ